MPSHTEVFLSGLSEVFLGFNIGAIFFLTLFLSKRTPAIAKDNFPVVVCGFSKGWGFLHLDFSTPYHCKAVKMARWTRFMDSLHLETWSDADPENTFGFSSWVLLFRRFF